MLLMYCVLGLVIATILTFARIAAWREQYMQMRDRQKYAIMDKFIASVHKAWEAGVAEKAQKRAGEERSKKRPAA